MTKEEKIQEAYGEYWETVKDYVDEGGWTESGTCHDGITIDFEIFDIDLETREEEIPCGFFNETREYVRPKSLQGIENNNGWIKIESESDLPRENIECFYILEVPERYSNAGKQINTGSFKFGKNIMSQQENYFTQDNFFYHRLPFVTHYQPIQKPEPPKY